MNTQDTQEAKGRGSADVSYLGKTIDRMIWEYMEEKQIPGLTLAIVQAPYIPRVVGYGLSDVGQRRLASAQTLWPVGPISQAYAAIAVMQLYEDGALDLADPISRYLEKVPASWAEVTLLQLMRHTSGIPDYRCSEHFHGDKAYSFDELMRFAQAFPVAFEPDTDVWQSATNFLLLAEIIERVSGMAYQRFVTSRQFEAIGLKHTCFFEDIAKRFHEDVSKNGNVHSLFKQDPRYVDPAEAAVGYDGEGQEVRGVSTSSLKGFADVWASAGDVSFWDICLAGSILVKKPENRALLYSPFTLATCRVIPAMVGWNFYHHRGLMDIKGSVHGFSAFLSRFTDASELVCVTLLANKEGVDFGNLARKIAAAFGDAMGTGSNDNELALYECAYGPQETVARLEQELKKRSIPLFATFDHGENAAGVGLSLRPTRVLVFGSPAVGTRLMQKNQSIALELPLRMAVWEDEAGSTWLGFPKMTTLAERYGMQDEPVLQKMTVLLESIASRVAGVY